MNGSSLTGQRKRSSWPPKTRARDCQSRRHFVHWSETRTPCAPLGAASQAQVWDKGFNRVRRDPTARWSGAASELVEAAAQPAWLAQPAWSRNRRGRIGIVAAATAWPRPRALML
jgi:hypothetical protein